MPLMSQMAGAPPQMAGGGGNFEMNAKLTAE